MSESVIEPTETDEIQGTNLEQVEPDVPDTDETLERDADEGDADKDEAQPETGGPAAKARRQAAGYRAQLRTAESRVSALRDQLIEQALGTDGVKLAALAAAGIDLDTLFDENDRISSEAVEAAAATARESLGITPSRFRGTADQGMRGKQTPAPQTASWGSLLDPTPNARR